MIDLSDVKCVEEVSDENTLNSFLKIGWVLLAVATEKGDYIQKFHYSIGNTSDTPEYPKEPDYGITRL